ncbi:peptidyl-tRNA hydrolase [Corynebacterium cystitidis]|uniref:peptidyl-tRNA hydrolase n=1 Tax=Corynebacterium cystitidis TaxID=35757 RepID=UPI00211E8FD3|nr:peptidyl-tRNA hydrolase [Corynebacterium cystitidis]
MHDGSPSEESLIAAAHAVLSRSVSSDRRDRHEDPDDPSTVQAMQIALHLPKQDPPDRNAVLVAAAQAVVGVCLAPQAGQDGPWRDGLTSWYRHLIRKVARRGRNKAWDDVQEFPGVTASVRGAQVRAFVPSAVSEVPAPIKKLQIHGTDLPASKTPVLEPRVPTIAVDAALNMTVGKAAAQVGHASMLWAAQLSSSQAVSWALAGFPLNVVECSGEAFVQAVRTPGALCVRDAGFTEIAADSVTAAIFREII